MVSHAIMEQTEGMGSSTKLAETGTFARWVQDIRNAKRMTQEQFAEALRVSRATVAKWETGAGFARQKQNDALRVMAASVGIPASPHLSPSDLRENEAGAAFGSTEHQLLKLFRQLAPEDQVNTIVHAANLLVRRAGPSTQS